MFKKALLGSDLSPASDRVIEYMKTLRTIGCEEVILTHVIYVKHLVGLSEMLREEAQQKLNTQKSALESYGYKVSLETPVGVPGPTLTSLALERGCSLIVVGSHGHSMTHEIALGGVATDVIHLSDVPVLVVRLRIHEENGEVRCCVASTDILSHVLYATDFSDNAERAFKYVEEFARAGCKKMTLMHVQEASRIRPYLEHKLAEFNEIDRSRLDRMATQLRNLGVEAINIELPYGKPAKEIVDYAAEKGVSIIIMGTHGRGFIADIFLGGTAHNVVRLSPAPVLLIPPIA
jgi:nucleotide-binding universal stress UspA family protein